MAAGLEPAFTPGLPVWPLAALAGLEPDDPDLEIPFGALREGIREASERYFAANQNGFLTIKPLEPLGPRQAKADGSHKWKLALLLSCCFHVAIALFFIQATDEAVQIEGADFAGIAVLGTASANQVQSGEISEDEATVDVTMVTLLDATPVENLEAKAVPVYETVAQVETVEAVTTDIEILKPVGETPVERAQPTDRLKAAAAEPQAPTPSDRAEPEKSESTPAPAITETVPEVLATDRVDDDNVVQKPARMQAADLVETAQAEPVERVEPVAEVTPGPKAEVKTERPVERTAEPAKPIQKRPVAEKKTAKKAEARKLAEKADKKQKKAGKRGQNETDARRGQADGRDKGDGGQASRGGSRSGAVGNAAVSNYPGKVRSKLARVARSVRARGRGEVLVAFSVGSNGSVRSVRVARSSGVDSVDQAALQAVRKASPFPPIPANAGRATWEFSVPLAFRR